MVAHVLRLRLDLLIGALRGDRRAVVRRLIGALAVIAAVVAVFVAARRLSAVDAEAAQAVTVIAGSALVLGAFVAALIGSTDDQLDPRRFAVFGVSPGRTAAVILLASLLSVPVLALIAIGVAVFLLWTARGAAAPLTAVAVILGIVTVILAAKTGHALAGLILPARRTRELTGLLLVGVIVIAVPLAVFLVSLNWRRGEVPPELAEAVRVLAVSPLGAAWAVPGASVLGSATGSLVVAAGTVVVLAGVWALLVRRILTTTTRPDAGRERAGLGWFALTPGTPVGGVAARSLLYWFRDPRHLVNLLVVPIAAIVVVLPLLLVGVPIAYIALVPAPLMALLFGWLPHNDLAYDSTAVWMHVASAVRGAADRLGRLGPVFLVGAAALAVAVPVTGSLHGDVAMLPALAGVCASLFLCALGLSSLSSVIAPYPVSRPGDSPFEQPQRTGGGLAQGVVLVGALGLSLPALWYGWRALAGDTDAALTTLWMGLGVGLVVLLIGILAGGAVFDRSGGRLMEFAEST